MNSFVIAIIILVLLGLIVIAVSFRRGDTSAAIGQLAGETVRRDRSNAALDGPGEASAGLSGAVASGKEIEAAARGGSPGTLVAAKDLPPVVYVPPDPETLCVTRRQFPNRSIVATFSFGLTAFGGACLAFLWPRRVVVSATRSMLAGSMTSKPRSRPGTASSTYRRGGCG